MTDDDGRSVLELLQRDELAVLQRWVAMAAAQLQGRLTPAELEPGFGELLSTLAGALGKGDVDIRSEGYATPRALLAECPGTGLAAASPRQKRRRACSVSRRSCSSLLTRPEHRNAP